MSDLPYLRRRALELRISDADGLGEVPAGLPHKDSDPEAAEIRLLKERLRLLEDDVRWLLRAAERRL